MFFSFLLLYFVAFQTTRVPIGTRLHWYTDSRGVGRNCDSGSVGFRVSNFRTAVAVEKNQVQKKYVFSWQGSVRIMYVYATADSWHYGSVGGMADNVDWRYWCSVAGELTETGQRLQNAYPNTIIVDMYRCIHVCLACLGIVVTDWALRRVGASACDSRLA